MSLVERYARALGVWRDPDAAIGASPVVGWLLDRRAGGYGVWHRSSQTERGPGRALDEPTALLFEHTLASGESFDVGLCGACRGDGVERTRHRPCPTCTVPGKPTGRDVRTLAQLMVEAMPRVLAENDLGRFVEPGNPEAHEHLATAADQLQLRGEPLGTWLALWLAGECQHPCCEGGQHPQATQENLDGWADAFGLPHDPPVTDWPACPDCHGTGQALGAEQGAMETSAEADYLELTYAAIDPAEYKKWFGRIWGGELELAAAWKGGNLTLLEMEAVKRGMDEICGPRACTS